MFFVVPPSKRHRAVGIETGKTTPSNDSTVRCDKKILFASGTRETYIVRKTLSFSKKLDNHIGVIWYFIHHYNVSLPI